MTTTVVVEDFNVDDIDEEKSEDGRRDADRKKRQLTVEASAAAQPSGQSSTKKRSRPARQRVKMTLDQKRALRKASAKAKSARR
jgi:hypothetical protein